MTAQHAQQFYREAHTQDCPIKKSMSLQARWLELPVKSNYKPSDAQWLLAEGYAPITYPSSSDNGGISAAFRKQACRSCDDCIPVRIPLKNFTADSDFFRELSAKNKTIHAVFYDGIQKFNRLPDALTLYRMLNVYMNDQHQIPLGSISARDTFDSYAALPGSSISGIKFVQNNKIAGFSLTQIMGPDAYASRQFYDLGLKDQQIGYYMLMTTLLRLKEQNIRYAYLGAHVPNTAYGWKAKMVPLEMYMFNQWLPCETQGQVRSLRKASGLDAKPY